MKPTRRFLGKLHCDLTPYHSIRPCQWNNDVGRRQWALWPLGYFPADELTVDGGEVNARLHLADTQLVNDGCFSGVTIILHDTRGDSAAHDNFLHPRIVAAFCKPSPSHSSQENCDSLGGSTVNLFNFTQKQFKTVAGGAWLTLPNQCNASRKLVNNVSFPLEGIFECNAAAGGALQLWTDR